MGIVGREPGVVKKSAGLCGRVAHGIVEEKRDEIDEEKRDDEAEIARQKLRQKCSKLDPFEGGEVAGQDAEAIERKARIDEYGQRVGEELLQQGMKLRSRITERPEYACEVCPEDHQAEDEL